MEVDINQNLFEVGNFEQISKTNCDDLLRQINIYEARRNKNKIVVLNYAIITYIKNENKALSKLKREKFFALNIDSKNELLIKVLDFLLANCHLLTSINADKKYFESKRNLAYISNDVYFLSSEIQKIIKNYGKSFIRDILYIADTQVYKTMNNIEFSSIATDELLIEACSFLIYLCLKINNEHSISQKTFSPIDSSKNYKQLNTIINNAIKIKQFQDMEKLIDNFDYVCLLESKEIVVKNEDSLFEKSRIYGDYHSNMQRVVGMHKNAKGYRESGASSFESFVDSVLDESKNLFEFRAAPIERYIFSFQITAELINKDEYFLEEILDLEEIRKEYFLDDVMNFKIASTLTLKDIMKVKRVLTIMGKLNSKFLSSAAQEDESKKQAVYNSWIKVFKHDAIKSLLANYIGEDKAEEFISEFAWSLDKGGKLDLQFTPFIKSTDYYLPMNILISSNLFRNSLFKNNIRPHDIRQNDLISKGIGTILKRNFQFVETEVEFKTEKYHGDFDVIAYIDNILYVFECKNIITPADLHELRTTYTDNIKKGFAQLEKYSNALADQSFVNYINNKLNWSLPTEPKVVTCLVLGSRMFNGYTDGTHHIRSFHELFSFLDYGKMNINSNGKSEQISLWIGESITGADIYNFLEKRILHEPAFDSFAPLHKKVDFKNFNLIFETFKFNVENFFEKIKKNSVR